MPFQLLNAGSSFCYLMEHCLGEQQFVTLLLYLNDICIFAPMIDDCLDWLELVFNRLKQFGQGHQGIKRTIALCWEQCSNTMFQDVTNYVKNVRYAKQ